MNLSPHYRRALWLLLLLVFLLSGFPSGPRYVHAVGARIDPALVADMAADPARRQPVILEMAQPRAVPAARSNGRRAAEALGLLNSLGRDATAAGGLPLIGGAAGFANARALDALSRNPNVAYIHRDSVVAARSASDTLQGGALLGAPYPMATKANRLWLEGTTGKGVGVAVLDSGIAPHDDLTLPVNRIVAAVNFAGDLGGMPDAGGHGTHMAGIIAGNSTRQDLAGQQTQFLSTGDPAQADYVGMAPGASLIDVRVLDAQGHGRISSVVAGLQWVIDNRVQYNIRVVNLSLGAPISASYRQDPLSAALEIAWKRGIVVVTAAGNGGPKGGTVETPGIDPYVITVGALDDLGTLATQDDALASFSSWGKPLDSTPKPNLVSPGRRIVSLRVPGSYLDLQYPDRLVAGRTGPNYFRLTGTSMSTAILSGTVALMLQRQPSLTPDQVKAILLGATQPYGQTAATPLPDPSADGNGLVNAYAAATGSPAGAANRGLRPADGFARALYPILYGQKLPWKDPYYAGLDWNNLAWDYLAWDNLAWDNLAWDNLAWDNLAWDNLAWDNLAWDNLAWDNLAWDARGWDDQQPY